MTILEKEVLITVNPMNMKHYEKLNYSVHNKKGSKILVKIEDVMEGSSSVKITKVCDECGKHVENVVFTNLMKSRKNTDGKDRCRKCARNYGATTRKNNVKYENSFEYYAIKNGLDDLLMHFSTKNNKKPSEISKGNTDEYIWECKVCNSEYKMTISSKLQSKVICSYCDGRKVNETNCLHVSHPEIAKLLKNDQKGYEISKGMHVIEELICPDCGNIEKKRIDIVSRYGFNCSRCSDGISYPEKFFVSFLKQTGVKFEKEKVFEWSKISKDINKRYDFYLTDLNIIIETHGGQHFNKGGFYTLGGRNPKEEQENDSLKEKLAKENGIENYIIIDCSLSNLEFIKNSILKSEIIKYIELSNINWLKCHEYSCNSLVKVACNLWNEYRNTTVISKKINISNVCVLNYLKQGLELGWCDYSPTRKIIQLDLKGNFIKEWNSMKEADEHLNINRHTISSVCAGKKKSSGGFKWMYKEEYDRYIENKLILNN